MATENCIALIRKAAPDLSKQEIEEIDNLLAKRANALKAQGKIDGLDQKVQALAVQEGDKLKLAAALQRKHAALNAIVRDKVDRKMQVYLDAGLSRQDAVLGILEGTVRTPGGKTIGNRVSVNAQNMAFERKFVSGMMGEIDKIAPGMLARIDDEAFNYNVVREWGELRDGGRPGLTGDKNALAVARTFAKYAEGSRQILNDLGANIGKLEGWVGPQVEDHHKLLVTDAATWAAKIMPRLDLERTFPDLSPEEIPAVLQSIYDTKVTGRDKSISEAQKGDYRGPANMAKSLGEHRVLHFRDAEAWIEHHKEFGHGTVSTSMMEHQRRMANKAAAMSVLGPNPENMIRAVIASHQHAERLDTTQHAGLRKEAIDLVNDHAVEAAIAELTKMTSIPTSVRLSKITADVKAAESMAKLGGVLISSVGGDLVTSAMNLKYQGRSFFGAIGDLIGAISEGRNAETAKEINYLTGEGFDGIIHAITNRYDTMDGPVGALSKLTGSFFKWSGITWWTDMARAANARIMNAALGQYVGMDYAAVPASYRHMLGQHGIGEREWAILREAQFKGRNGNIYLDPNMIQNVPDGLIEAYVKPEADAIRAGKNPDAVARGLARLFDRTKLDLELAVRRMTADETNFAMLEPDAVTRRYTLQGTRPGSVPGTIMRLITQFKAYPVAFTHRVLGRSLYGQMGDTMAQRILNSSRHIGQLIAGLTVAGYAAQTAKDYLRGYEPRDPTKPKTILSSLLQSGGLGIYGDFLFSQSNRFGGGTASTLIGPAIGTATDAVDLMLKARDGDARAADFLSFGLQNAPFANLFYARASLDYLILNSWKESLSPGYLSRMDQRRLKDYGQTRAWGPEAFAN